MRAFWDRHDAISGLNVYRARYYDAQIGRFLNPDCVGFAGQDTNLYRYVANGPADSVDPTGNIGVLGVILIGVSIGLIYALVTKSLVVMSVAN